MAEDKKELEKLASEKYVVRIIRHRKVVKADKTDEVGLPKIEEEISQVYEQEFEQIDVKNLVSSLNKPNLDENSLKLAENKN
ncbi:MAG: hypothetical protein WC737_05660 [Parcubacteria group bacterium]|jgi:DNA polymerase I-like protein with 3'-5' exonuclease and polymerase domains